jgi:hypothetical protein
MRKYGTSIPEPETFPLTPVIIIGVQKNFNKKQKNFVALREVGGVSPKRRDWNLIPVTYN